MSAQTYQHYRQTTVGSALQDVLEEYVRDGRINEHLRNKTLAVFDNVMSNALHDMGKHKASFMGEKLVAYRFCDNVWTLIVKNVTFTDQTRTFDTIGKVERIKIVACDGREATQMARRGPTGA
ncbi:unnamed protein product, partial [Mesorhabditis spiculigera]